MTTPINWSDVQLSLRPVDEEELRTALEFQKLWAPTGAVGAELGWKVEPGSRVQLYFLRNPASVALDVFVTPSKRDRFLFRVTPRPGALGAIRDAVYPVATKLPGAEVVIARTPRKGNVMVDVVEVRSSWEDVVGDDRPSSETVATRLRDFVVPLLKAIPTR